jgi:dCMP deaminase
MKEKFINAHIDVAEVYSKLSSCERLQVGCVIVKNDTIIGIGYNGTPKGDDNCCEDGNGYTKPETIHAEINALMKVARSTNSTENSDIFITHSPCIECAKAIKQAGINSVYYKNTYRSDDGINFLKTRGVAVIKIGE